MSAVCAGNHLHTNVRTAKALGATGHEISPRPTSQNASRYRCQQGSSGKESTNTLRHARAGVVVRTQQLIACKRNAQSVHQAWSSQSTQQQLRPRTCQNLNRVPAEQLHHGPRQRDRGSKRLDQSGALVPGLAPTHGDSVSTQQRALGACSRQTAHNTHTW